MKGELNFSDAFIEAAVRTAESQLVNRDPEAVLATMAQTLPERLQKDDADRDEPLAVGGDKAGTAGAMVESTALEAACAEIAAYERSLQLLSDRSLVRLTPSIDGRRRVALIHDGFGDTMDSWARMVRRDPLSAIESTTALSAQQLLKNLGEEGLPPSLREVMGTEAIENVRWISCYITANIRNWTFRNCRFSSTLFKKCVFENVRFENCEFRGALFLECTFKGDAGVVIAVGDDKRLGDECRISAVTVKQSGMADGGLTFVGVVGAGLLFEKCYGGPWRLVNCELRHVSVHGEYDASKGQVPLWGRIDDSPAILNLSITGDVGEETVVRDSWIYMGTYPVGHRLNPKGLAKPDLTMTEPQERPITQSPPADS